MSTPAASRYPERLLKITQAADLAVLPARPAVLLSASVPYERPHAELSDPAEVRRRKARDRRYAASAYPERIRLAVVELALGVLRRGGRLVFGGHPAISPMVLHAARDLAAAPDSVLVFQSALFEPFIPDSTHDLADWQAGRMVLTPVRPADASGTERANSLRLMRGLMAQVPGLRGAVFIGGMDGLVEESALFHQHQPSLPRYALASTGGAARLDLFKGRLAREHCGGLGKERLEAEHPSYAVLTRLMLDDMGLAAASR